MFLRERPDRFQNDFKKQLLMRSGDNRESIIASGPSAKFASVTSFADVDPRVV